MHKTFMTLILAGAALALVAAGETKTSTAPATQPASDNSPQQPPEQLLKDMLRPQMGVAKPIAPTIDPPPNMPLVDKSKAVAPNAPPTTLQREGTFIFDRVGRMSHTADGSQAEFTFEADGKTMKDPPVIILPNLKLMAMEDVVRVTNRDLRFRVTGMLTEYHGRNFLLLEKVVVPPEGNAQF